MPERRTYIGIPEDIEKEMFSPPPCGVDLSLLCTPLDQCVRVKLGKPEKAVIQKLVDNGYDQAPVYTPSLGIGARLVSTELLRALEGEEKSLQERPENFLSDDLFELPLDVLEIEFGPLQLAIGLSELLGRLRVSQAFLICHHLPEREYHSIGGGSGGVFHPADGSGDTVMPKRPDEKSGHIIEVYEKVYLYGLVTLADLNKGIVRKAGYELFMDIESHLSQLIQYHYASPYDWIQLLNEGDQVHALGWWDLSRRRVIDINPVASLGFTQLLQITSKSGALLGVLEYRSRAKFDKATGVLPQIRNRIMHPVRPLVLSSDDLVMLKTAIDCAVELRTKAINALKRRPSGEPVKEG